MPRHGTLHFEPGQFVVLEVKLESGPRRSALALPFAILAHGVRWGWGLLFLLPFSLLATGHFASLLDTTDRTRKYLPYHIAFSALALALTLVHLYTAVMYR